MARHQERGRIDMQAGTQRASTFDPATPARTITRGRPPRRGAGLALRVALILMAPTLAPRPATAAGQSCEGLAAFQYPDATVTMAQSQPGGPYVAPDAWHQVFTTCRRTAASPRH